MISWLRIPPDRLVSLVCSSTTEIIALEAAIFCSNFDIEAFAAFSGWVKSSLRTASALS